MKDLEKQIKEAANKYSDEEDGRYSFIKGAISPEAKEYWFNTFIDEIIENKTFLDFASKCASKKYEVGSKEHAIATMSIKFGMGCSLTKEYWQQGMYSEKEVKQLLNQCNCLSKSIEDFNEQDWFEQNKKKCE